MMTRDRLYAKTALGCADAVPWRCHRPFTADALLVRGIRTYEERLIAKTVCRVLGLPGGKEMGHEDKED